LRFDDPRNDSSLQISAESVARVWDDDTRQLVKATPDGGED